MGCPVKPVGRSIATSIVSNYLISSLTYTIMDLIETMGSVPFGRKDH